MEIFPVPEAANFMSPVLWSEPRQDEIEIFNREFLSFLPEDAFDAHAHLWDCAHVAQAYDWPAEAEYSRGHVNLEVYRQRQRSWMGQSSPQNGLFFGWPARNIDRDAENDFVYDALKGHPGSRGLLLIKPTDDPAEVEAKVFSQGWAGFKVYHVYAERPDTQNSFIDEFLPEWAWEIAQRFGLSVMLHQVRERSLSDVGNQKIINAMCRKYPDAKLILAHAARGFCAKDTVEGISAIAGLANVYFDSSAICESEAFEAIIDTFGPKRLLYGSDFAISEVRGRAVTSGDGFHWLYEWQQEQTMGKPILVGLESLRALKKACRAKSLNDRNIENIFRDNARELLGLKN